MVCMANCVYYVPLKIELDLTEDDLGHPEYPDLWEQLRHRPKWLPDLQCPECLLDRPHCPEWMYLRVQNGKRIAVHKNANIADHPSGESDEHKALKERTATAAVRGGFSADIEARADHRRRQTDVLVHGADGFLLGCEAQLSYATVQTIKKRTAIAEADGIQSLWACDNAKANLIDKAPWARIDRMPWHRIADNTEPLPVRGGIRALEKERCRDRATVCPDRGHGRCDGWHGKWDPRQLPYDELIVRAAARTYTPVFKREKRLAGSWFWVPKADLDEFEVMTGTRLGVKPPIQGKNSDEGPNTDPLSRQCRYGENTGLYADPAPVRDDGHRIDATGLTLTDEQVANPVRRVRYRVAVEKPRCETCIAYGATGDIFCHRCQP